MSDSVLQNLKALHDAGVLTDAEFVQKVGQVSAGAAVATAVPPPLPTAQPPQVPARSTNPQAVGLGARLKSVKEIGIITVASGVAVWSVVGEVIAPNFGGLGLLLGSVTALIMLGLLMIDYVRYLALLVGSVCAGMVAAVLIVHLLAKYVPLSLSFSMVCTLGLGACTAVACFLDARRELDNLRRLVAAYAEFGSA